MSDTKVPIQESTAVTGVEAAPERGSRWQVAWRALRHRNFRLFFGGQLISLIGTWMQSVAQSWLAYRLTGATVLLGVVGVCRQARGFSLGPAGGAPADRLRRRRVLVATQTASMILALVLAALTLTGRVRVGH